MRDIAERANTSIGTVSMVLNGRGGRIRVSERTRRAVLDAADALEYTPNLVARRLRADGNGRRSLMLAVAHPIDSRLSLVSRIVSGMQRHLDTDRQTFEALGYDVQLTMETFVPGELHRLRGLREPLWYNGLLVSNTSPEGDSFLEAHQTGVPIVAFQRNIAISYVNADNFAAAGNVADHLIGLGHRQFTVVTPGVDAQAIRLRVEGFNCRLAAAGLPAADLVVAHGDNWTENAYHASMRRLASSPGQRPTAIFATNDLLALGVMRAARDCGLLVPDDLAVIGFDDVEFAPFTSPALTSVHLPIEEMAAEAVAMLFDLVQRRVEVPVQKFFPTLLIVRESCGAARRSPGGQSLSVSDHLERTPPVGVMTP